MGQLTPAELTAVRRMLAEREITAALHRYVRGVDRMDRDLVASAYHPDAVDVHGTFEGTLEEYLEWLWRVLERYEMSSHYLANISVEWDDDQPDTARVETYGMSLHPSPDPAPKRNLVIGFRYIDVFTHENDQWRIKRRVAVTDWIRIDSPQARFPIADHFLSGKRDGTDIIQQPWSALWDVHAPQR